MSGKRSHWHLKITFLRLPLNKHRRAGVRGGRERASSTPRRKLLMINNLRVRRNAIPVSTRSPRSLHGAAASWRSPPSPLLQGVLQPALTRPSPPRRPAPPAGPPPAPTRRSAPARGVRWLGDAPGKRSPPRAGGATAPDASGGGDFPGAAGGGREERCAAGGRAERGRAAGGRETWTAASKVRARALPGWARGPARRGWGPGSGVLRRAAWHPGRCGACRAGAASCVPGAGSQVLVGPGCREPAAGGGGWDRARVRGCWRQQRGRER